MSPPSGRWSVLYVAVPLLLSLTGLFGAACSQPNTGSLGHFLERDGVRTWYRSSGRGPDVVYVHGGPGHHSAMLERSAGPLLEQGLRLHYVDQRGSGRSDLVGERDLGMEDLVEDFEALRKQLGLERFHLLAHSFGGMIALEYWAKHPERVGSMILVDVSPMLSQMVENQVRTLKQKSAIQFADRWPELQSTVRAAATPVMQLSRLYQTLGTDRVSRMLQYPSDAGARRALFIERSSGLRGRGRGRTARRLYLDGYFRDHPELMLKVPQLLMIRGTHSEMVGEALFERTRIALQAQALRFDHSGHYPFLDEPERFSRVVIDWFRSIEPSQGPNQPPSL